MIGVAMAGKSNSRRVDVLDPLGGQEIIVTSRKFTSRLSVVRVRAAGDGSKSTKIVLAVKVQLEFSELLGERHHFERIC